MIGKHYDTTCTTWNATPSFHSPIPTPMSNPEPRSATARIRSCCCRAPTTTSTILIKTCLQCHTITTTLTTIMLPTESGSRQSTTILKIRRSYEGPGKMNPSDGWLLHHNVIRYNNCLIIAYAPKKMRWNGGNLTSICFMIRKRSRSSLRSTVTTTLSQTGLLTR